ncbi:MAG: deoxyribose-phosphate aldolase [Candidatus Eremiobacteraeota bacterium]|nr:deoxyribose-phosphate aldolase [Candidatus Eremiobacteraeota bacterium]
MLEARAAQFTKRSIKGAAKLAGIDLAIACMDLTTLEGRDSPGRVRSLCAKALSPAPGVRPVGAVCVYPNLVGTAKAALEGSPVKVASVATAFPSGLSSIEVKLQDTRAAIDAGADEVDMVIDRGAFLAGNEDAVWREIVEVKRVCAAAPRAVALKAILETGELGSYDAIRRASDLALYAGADFIKTSTGKITTSSTLPTALCMAEAIRDFERRTGALRGFKAAGGIRNTKTALAYLVLLKETLDERWLAPGLFRIGASSLLDDLLMQREKELTGHYAGIDYYTRD